MEAVSRALLALRRFVENHIVFLAVTLAAAIFALLLLQSRGLIPQLEELERASEDNIPWNLAQAETEFLRLRLALAAPQPANADEARARERQVVLWFDIFYSRLATLRDGEIYSYVREDSQFQESLARIWTYLEASSALIDSLAFGGDTAELATATEAIATEVRAVALSGITRFSNLANQRRQELFSVLGKLGVAIAASFMLIVIFLLALGFFVRRLTRISSEYEATAAWLQAVISTSPLPIIITDDGGRVIEFNSAAEAAFGFSRADLLGHDAMRALSDDVDRRSGGVNPIELARRALPEGRNDKPTKTLTFRIRLRHRSGRSIPCEVMLARRESGSKSNYIAFIRDISSWEDAANELRHARDSAKAGERAKERMLSTMSHEMRTPLHAMMAALDLIMATSVNVTQRRYLTTMTSAARQLLRLINDVLDVARLEHEGVILRPTRVDIAKLMAEVLHDNELIVSDSGNTLRLEIPMAISPDVSCDAIRLKQVLNNLISNANKFTCDGMIEVGCRYAETSGRLEFWVCDHGSGIAESDLANIFDDFYTAASIYSRKQDGTGLGLGIVKRVVTAMGGEVSVQSVRGRGSTFSFTIEAPPACQSIDELNLRQSGHWPLPVKSADAPHKLRILFAEDNRTSRHILFEGLQRADFDVTAVADGEAAVAAAKARAFDVILMDISMPGMDGVAATREIRSCDNPNQKTPVIALTAHAFPEEQKRFRDSGFNAVCAKPVSMRELSAKIFSLVPPAQGAISAIDTTHFSDLVDNLGRERAAAIVDEFSADMHAALSALREARAWESGPEVPKRIVHQMMGAAALIGASALVERLSIWNNILQTKEIAGATPEIDNFEALLTETIDELRSAVVTPFIGAP